MNFTLSAKQENTVLSELLLTDKGNITPVPFDILNNFTQEELSLFCLMHGVYQLPLVELIQFLRVEIGGRSALEIGAGNGCIGRSLGIKTSDNHMQLIPEIRNYYENIVRQPIVKYGKDVENLDAISAVKKYKPEVVVACWVTHLYKPGMEVGNPLGIEEELLFANGVKKYIHVGNTDVHSQKPILSKMKYRTYQFPWLVSRSMNRDNNIIYIFEKQ